MSVGMVVDAVAKTKAKPAKGKSVDRKPMAIQVRGSVEWKAWAEALANQQHDTLAKLVERSLIKVARDNGFPDPPKR